MPPKSETPAEQAKRLRAVARNLETAADFQVVCDAMKEAPSAIPQILQLLKEIGVITTDGQFYTVVASTKKAQAAKEPKKVLSRNFTTWEMVPLAHYEQRFAAMEPASLSPANMKAV